MKKTLILIIIILVSIQSKAQFIKEKSINAQIGLGMSTPYYSAGDIANDGFFIQGEYVLKASSWFELRPYAGLVMTNSNGKDLNNNPTFEKAETKAFLLGAKARVKAPIRYIAPYVEIGLGSSIGSFNTYTYYTDISKKGIIYHIPFSFGLELGRNNNVDLGFSYYFQPTVEQAAGSFAVGIQIPLKN